MPDHTGPPREPGAAAASRRRLRIGAVLAVLVVELVATLGALRLDDAAQQRRVEVARVEALSDTLQAGAAARVVGPVLIEAVDDLVASGAPGAGAVARAAADPELGTDPGRAALAAATARSAARVDAQVASRDRLAVGLVLGLQLLMWLGWWAWSTHLVVLARRRRTAYDEEVRREVDHGERRLQALMRTSTDVIVVLDPDSAVTFISPAAATVLGRDPDQLVGRRLTTLLGAHERELLTRLLAHTDPAERAITLRVPHPDGRLLTLEGTVENQCDDDAVQGWLMTLSDVSNRDAMEQDLTHQSLHDALTGLPNRRLLGDRIQQALRRRHHSRSPLAVLSIDLDDFKMVNDSLGHDIGDQVLIEVSRRLLAELQPGDTAARLGADQFVALLDDHGTPEGIAVAERLLAALDRPVVLAGEHHQVSASIGLAALARGEATGADPQLLRNADTAMHEAKMLGKDGYAVYDEQMHLRVVEELRMRAELADAISNGELVLHYQPTVSLTTQTISGFEALVRWNHPQRGLVFPGEFIALAESTGLVVPLGAWVLGEACRAAATMQHQDGGPTMAVNVAPLHLADPDFRTSVLEALEASGLPPHRLTLEITETVLLDGAEAGIGVLGELRALGIRVAIDDFGTGYNSLAQLSALPLDVLKIDKSFVDKLGGDAADSSLIDAIIAMSQALGLVTVAEGVEVVDQARWLRDHEVTLGQGYLWSRPVPLPAALDLLRTGLPALPVVPVDREHVDLPD